MKVKDLLLRQKNNDEVAIWHDDKRLTYAMWNENSERLAGQIKSRLDDMSEKVGIYLPNSIDYAVSYFAILNLDKIIIPIGIQAKEIEIASTMRYCDVDLLISHSRYKFLFEKVQDITDFRFEVFYIDIEKSEIYGKDKCNLDKKILINSDLAEEGDEVVIMLHTSGTTSDPKRVMLTNKSLLSNIQSNIESLKLTSNDKVCIALPMFFGYCNTAQFLSHIYVGGKMCIMSGIFSPHSFFEMVQTHKITNFTAVPTMLILLLNYKYSDRYDYSSLRFICFGGGVMSKNLLKKLILKYDTIDFIHTYGQTECSPRLTALLPPFTLSKLGSVGKPIPNVSVSVVDENVITREPYKEGEIVAQGDNIMKGYYKKPKETADIIKDGWIHTGDIGFFDEEGFLYISGRKKNIIIVGGQNVYPEEIEEIMRECKGIKDVYVYGIDDYYMGESVAAQIVMDEGLILNDVKEFCNQKLPKYKRPVKIETVDEINKTYNGKIRRIQNG